MTSPRPPVPPEVKSLYANLHAWWRRLSSIKLPADLSRFHQWERDAGPTLQSLGVSPDAQPEDRLTHYREAIRRHVGTLEAEHPALKAAPKARRNTTKSRAPRKP